MCPRERTYLKSLHGEADISIIKQFMASIKDEVNCLNVNCDDTDVFFFLTVYVFREDFKSEVLMEAFETRRSLVYINETDKKHAKVAPSFIDVHALSGCSSVPKLYSNGKRTVIKQIKDQNCHCQV